ncbi:MAG: hypothetical protein ACYDDF_04475 [Thermoplasmatota archaeon]
MAKRRKNRATHERGKPPFRDSAELVRHFDVQEEGLQISPKAIFLVLGAIVIVLILVAIALSRG